MRVAQAGRREEAARVEPEALRPHLRVEGERALQAVWQLAVLLARPEGERVVHRRGREPRRAELLEQLQRPRRVARAPLHRHQVGVRVGRGRRVGRVVVGALLHLDPDALGAHVVARDSAGLEQARVRDGVGADPRRYHFAERALGARHVSLPRASVHERVEGGAVGRDARGAHLSEDGEDGPQLVRRRPDAPSFDQKGLRGCREGLGEARRR
mmetsp:Transcript_16915/g.56103  ORF Transcript_16915/g.56103 Transcript_16915/m.56103 type:complete len:213 (+) Transcript_16915:768-1406(+)